VSLLLLDAARNRLVVAGGSVVRLWDLASLTCIAELEASHQVCFACVGVVGMSRHRQCGCSAVVTQVPEATQAVMLKEGWGS
jgi:hypothetical protein